MVWLPSDLGLVAHQVAEILKADLVPQLLQLGTVPGLSEPRAG